MKKKSFVTGFDSLLGENKSHSESIKKTSVKNETRSTFIVDCDQLESIKTIAFWEKKLLKEILNECLDMYIKKYKEENGEDIFINNRQ